MCGPICSDGASVQTVAPNCARAVSSVLLVFIAHLVAVRHLVFVAHLVVVGHLVLGWFVRRLRRGSAGPALISRRVLATGGNAGSGCGDDGGGGEKLAKIHGNPIL